MARVGLTKITPIKNISDKEITINGETISVKQYLSMKDKSELLNTVLGEILSDNGTESPLREALYTGLYIVKYYTNINFTQTMLDDAGKTYDLLEMNHIIQDVIDAIPDDEYNFIVSIIHKTVKSLSTYHLSAVGLFDRASNGQNSELQDLDTITDQLKTVAESPLLNEVLKKMG